MTDRLALYFGCWDQPGYYLHEPDGREVYRRNETYPDLPWTEGLMDGGLLNNGRHVDLVDGRVFWTCGGRPRLWFAFFWWDRSVDRRGACNSGFYVRGFEIGEQAAAFEYAKSIFPRVVSRQAFPLVLQP